jgi:Leucine-rich repeat (LRR) protein
MIPPYIDQKKIDKNLYENKFIIVNGNHFNNESNDINSNNDYKHKINKCLLLKQQIIDLSNINYLLFINELVDMNWLTELILKKCDIDCLTILPPKLKKLNVSHNMINEITYLPETLKELNISNNNMLVLDNLPQLNILNISHNALMSFNLPLSLVELDISHNNLSDEINLSSLVNLINLNISNNNLTVLTNLPPSLKLLNASKNKITYINISNLIKLDELNISLNEIEILDNLPINLKSLDASCNKITTCNDIKNLVLLKDVDLCKNQLSEIPIFHNQLLTLDISKNNLSSIGKLPDSLIEIDIAVNEIQNIENIPQNLEKLVAYYNKFKYIASFPKTLKYIDISNNDIVWIAEYPPNLEHLDVSFNKLKTISLNFPSTLHTLDISENEIKNAKIFDKYNIKNLSYDSDEYNEYDDNELTSWRNSTNFTIANNLIKNPINLPSYEDVLQENIFNKNSSRNFDNVDFSLFDSIKDDNNINNIILKNHYVV